MKKTITNQLYQTYAIPDGEGFIALPIVFINVIVRRSARDDEAIHYMRGKP